MYIFKTSEGRAKVRYKKVHSAYISALDLTQKRMEDEANYSTLCYVDSLNEENKRRLFLLSGDDYAPYTYYPGVGFKVPYTKKRRWLENGKPLEEDDTVFVVECVDIKSLQPERETVYVARYSREDATELLPEVKNSLSHSVPFLAGRATFRKVFLDRLSKKEQHQVMMLKLMEPMIYLEGCGLVRVYGGWGRRHYFLEGK